MDWMTVVFIIIFFVFPIIKQVLEQAAKNRRGGEGQGPTEFPTEDSIPVPRESVPVPRQPAPVPVSTAPGKATAEGSENWSSDWGTWPGAETEKDIPVEFDRQRLEPVGHRPLTTRDDLPTADQQIAAAKTTFWDPAEGTAPGDLEERLRRIRAPASSQPRRQPRHTAAPELSAYRSSPASRLPLRNRRDLRQAIILGEVLGPPLSILGSEERRRWV